MPNNRDLENWFGARAPTPQQVGQHEAIRAAAKTFAAMILEQSPASADQTAALRKIREAVWTATAAIDCGGR